MSGVVSRVFDVRSGTPHVGGVPLCDVVAQLSTPTFLFDFEAIDRRIDSIRANINHRPISILYPVKAYANVSLIGFLWNQGLRFDACSPGDLAFLSAANVPSSSISFLAHGPSHEELQNAVAQGVHVVAGSLAQIEHLAALGAGSIGLRINPGIEAGYHAHVRSGGAKSHFGVSNAQIAEAHAICEVHGMRIVGLHAHVGSDILDVDVHLNLLRKQLDYAERLDAIEYLNLGGGWGVPFVDAEDPYPLARFGREADKMLNAHFEKHGRRLELRVEPGTYLVREAGFYVVRVNEVALRDGRQVVSVDGNTNQLIATLLYGAQHPVVAVCKEDAPAIPSRIVGNLMQAGDVLTEHAVLPPLQVGDKLVYGLAGAYCSSRGSRFNQRELPSEHALLDRRLFLTRSSESSQELLRNQFLPDDPSPRSWAL